jgi:hypothetical protein
MSRLLYLGLVLLGVLLGVVLALDLVLIPAVLGEELLGIDVLVELLLAEFDVPDDVLVGEFVGGRVRGGGYACPAEVACSAAERWLAACGYTRRHSSSSVEV